MKWPADQIDEVVTSRLVPPGAYITRARLTETISKNGKLMYKFVGVIDDDHHPDEQGVPLIENFTIGSAQCPVPDFDEDPELWLLTWKTSPGAGRMKQCLTAAGITISEDVDEMIAQEFRVGVNNGHKMEQKFENGAPVFNDKGQPVMEPRNNIRSFFTPPASNGVVAPRQQVAPPAPAVAEPAKRGPGRPRKDETVVPAQAAKPAAAAAGKVVDCGFGCGWKGPLAGLPAHVAQAHADDEE